MRIYAVATHTVSSLCPPPNAAVMPVTKWEKKVVINGKGTSIDYGGEWGGSYTYILYTRRKR